MVNAVWGSKTRGVFVDAYVGRFLGAPRVVDDGSLAIEQEVVPCVRVEVWADTISSEADALSFALRSIEDIAAEICQGTGADVESKREEAADSRAASSLDERLEGELSGIRRREANAIEELEIVESWFRRTGESASSGSPIAERAVNVLLLRGPCWRVSQPSRKR